LTEECSVVEEMQHAFHMYFTQVRSAVLNLLHTDRHLCLFPQCRSYPQLPISQTSMSRIHQYNIPLVFLLAVV